MMVVLSQLLNISSIKREQRTFLLLPKMEPSLESSPTLLSDFTFFLFFALLNVFPVSQKLDRVFLKSIFHQTRKVPEMCRVSNNF